ncbi:MAG: GNAT family N-acetyltransferase [Phycisphaerales bacterium]|nr:GNAT family N-acetyltransferase [Phycisphaerales bacterium]
MTHCQSENNFPAIGLAWTAPNPLDCQLQTDRLIIRAYRLDDAEEVYNAINESRENHLLPWMPWAKDNHRTLESTTKYICEQMLALANPDTFKEVGTAIFDKQTNRFLGGSGIHDIRTDTASCETGYWIRKDATGNGYATEACARTISWALSPQSPQAPQANNGLGLHRVRIYCSGANAPSVKTVEKLNIKKEVHQRKDYCIQTLGPTDRLGWGVMHNEWDCKNHRALSQ